MFIYYHRKKKGGTYYLNTKKKTTIASTLKANYYRKAILCTVNPLSLLICNVTTVWAILQIDDKKKN